MKRLLCAFFVLALIFSLISCSAAPAATTKELPTKTTKSFDECIEQIDAAAKKIWSDRYVLEHSENSVTLSSWADDVSSGFQKALGGSREYEKSWNEMTESFRELSSNVQNVFTENSHDAVEAYVNILDEFKHDTLLYSAKNGKTVYDPVEHVDLIGVNSAAGAEIEKAFKDFIDGAEVTSQADFDTVNVSIKTEYTTDKEPDDWSTLTERLVELDENLESSRRIGTTIESANGTILLTVSNGKVMYDYYAGVTDIQHLDSKVGESTAPSRSAPAVDSVTVYVSKASNTVHSILDCSGMKNYRTMSLDEATERGYKFCTNCW